MLEAQDVTFAYGHDFVLRPLTLTIERGQIVGVLGPNGSGKTTLLRLMAGLLVPTSGRVMLDGKDLRRWPRRAVAQCLAVVPQETHLAFDYSVLEIALMGRYPHLEPFALEGPDDVQLARDALAATGTDHFIDRVFASLSGGEKQRVIIASALAQQPTLMFLDEPTASLDVAYELEIVDILRRLNRDRGLTLVVSTHDLNLAAALCDRLVLLRDGSLISTGPTNDQLTPESISRVFDVEAEVMAHATRGSLTVRCLRRIHEHRAAHQ